MSYARSGWGSRFDLEQEGGSRGGGRHGAGSGWPGRRSLTQSLPVQRKPGRAAKAPPPPDEVRQIAARGVMGPGSSLPHVDKIQASFGAAHELSSIRAHVGGAAAEASAAIGASAYAMGGDVAFAEEPDLHTAAHEAAHVVQQASGVNLYGGVGEAGDSYERHADAVADRVVRGESAVDLLDGPVGGPRSAAVQRKPAPAEEEFEPEVITLPEGDEATDRAAAGIDGPSSRLPDRTLFAAQTMVFVERSYTNFLAACQAVQALLERKLRDQTTGFNLFSLLFDVISGFLLPGLGAKITNTVIDTLLPPSRSAVAHKIALRLLESDTIGTLVKAAVAEGKVKAQSAWSQLVSKSGGPKPGDEFFQWLKIRADRATAHLLAEIPAFRDEPLIAIHLAYNPEVFNTYEAMVERVSRLVPST